MELKKEDTFDVDVVIDDGKSLATKHLLESEILDFCKEVMRIGVFIHQTKNGTRSGKSTFYPPHRILRVDIQKVLP